MLRSDSIRSLCAGLAITAVLAFLASPVAAQPGPATPLVSADLFVKAWQAVLEIWHKASGQESGSRVIALEGCGMDPGGCPPQDHRRAAEQDPTKGAKAPRPE